MKPTAKGDAMSSITQKPKHQSATRLRRFVAGGAQTIAWIHCRRSVVGLLSFILLLSSAVGALAGGSAPTNTLKFTESLGEKVLCVQSGDNWSCHKMAGDAFKISAKIVLTGVDIASFGPTTSFDLTLGDLHITRQLGDDPAYTAGTTKATFRATYLNSKGKLAVYQTVSLKWTATQLTVSVTGKTADITMPGWSTIQAANYVGLSTGPLTGTTSGSVKFGDTSIVFDQVPVTGSVATKQVVAKDTDHYEVSKVKIMGSGRGQSPSLPAAL